MSVDVINSPTGLIIQHDSGASLSTETGEILIRVGGCPITYHGIGEYFSSGHVPMGWQPEQGKKVEEVGCGLGGFLPWVVEQTRGQLEPKPVAIEPVPYGIVNGLLTAAVMQGDLTSEQMATALELRDRVAVITNSRLVQLIPCTLEQAIETHPELRASADLVVDFNGARLYSPRRYWVRHVEDEYLPKGTGFYCW
jgi:hypothetical protein